MCQRNKPKMAYSQNLSKNTEELRIVIDSKKIARRLLGGIQGIAMQEIARRWQTDKQRESEDF